MLTIYFDTLGCAKNTVDTFKMEQILINAGHSITDDPECADLIILNTCSFIEASAQESIDSFFEYKNFYKEKPVIVTGCLPSRYGTDLEKSLTEAAAFVPCDKEHQICSIVDSLNIRANNNINVREEQPKAFSYVKISEGCNKFCSYCTIPFIRGRYVSIAYDEIQKDVKEQIEAGAKEIVLVAQDCGVWGSDLGEEMDLAWLLSKLAKDFQSTYFRILYIQPDEVSDDLLFVVNKYSNIRKYLDIPLQHCNSEILHMMNRKGSTEKFLALIKHIRKKIPDITLRTTFILGFPGETDANFDELCQFVNDAKFDYAGCFEYSSEEGTKAAKLSNQLDSSTKYNRTNTLRDILDNISLDKLSSRIGEKHEIIIEGLEEERLYGRAEFQAPDVDGVVFISEYSDVKNLQIGDVVNVKIVDVEAYDLIGNII